MDYTFYLPSRSLLSRLPRYRTIGNYQRSLSDINIVLPGIFFRDTAAGLADNEGLISSVNSRKGSLSIGEGGNTSSAEDGESTPSGELHFRESEGSKFSHIPITSSRVPFFIN